MRFFFLVLSGALIPLTLGAEIIHLTTRTLTISERGEVQAWVAQTESNSFSFIPPHEWTLKCLAPENVLVLTSPDQSSRIRVKLDQPGLDGTNEVAWRTKLLSQFDRPELLHEFTCYTSGLEGRAYDLEEKPARGAPLWHRVALIPFRKGLVQILLTTNSRLTNTAALDGFLGSFRGETNKIKP